MGAIMHINENKCSFCVEVIVSMERVILHCDANSFYASCELARRPSLRGLPLAVCGSTQERHGIVLAATPEAKKRGVRTAMVNWEARRFCPDLIMLPPDYHLYMDFSRRLRQIYGEYTDRVEPLGLDECWLDVSGPGRGMDAGVTTAARLRRRAWEELGLTLSVGVSFNKVFAKLGSDMKKPHATTLIAPENYQNIAWNRPVEELLGVGRRLLPKMHSRGILTIGDLAAQPPEMMRRWLGKTGLALQRCAAGEDTSPVLRTGEESPIRSVGNSTTPPQDMLSVDDVQTVLYQLADSVGARLRAAGVRGKCVSLSVRDRALRCFAGQKTLSFSTAVPGVIVRTALDILRAKGFDAMLPFRSVGVSVSLLESDTCPVQLDMFGEADRREREEALGRAVDGIRRRFGKCSIA